MSNQNKVKGKSAPPKRRSKSTRSVAKPRNPRPVKAGSISIAPAVHRLCGLNDPFCGHSRGAQVFDMGSVRSFPFTYHDRTVLTTNAGGTTAALFLPNWLNNPVLNASLTTSTTATFANAGVVYGALGLSPSAFRVVSAGIVLRRISAPMTTTGMVRIRTFTPKYGTNLDSIPMASYNANDFEDIPLFDCREVAVASKRCDNTANEFQQPTAVWAAGSTVVNWQNPGYSVVFISIDGAPASTAALEIEFIINFELVLQDSDGLMVSAKPSPPANPLMSAANDLVSSEVKAIAKNGVVEFGRRVVNLATRAVVNAGLTYIGARPLQVAAMLAD